MLYHLNLLANLILQTYFENSRCLLIFSDNTNFTYTGNLQMVNIGLINKTFEKTTVFRSHGCQGIIIHTDYPVYILNYIEYQMRHNMDRFNTRKYLILPTENPKENAEHIFILPALEFIGDLLLVTKNESIVDKWGFEKKSSFKFYTHAFTGLTGNNKMICLGDWNSEEGFQGDHNLYPEKFHDGKGRPFKITTITYKPYSIPATKDGVELQMAVEFCEKFNLTPVLVVDEEDLWGEIYDNWTGNGILGNVLNDRGDVGFAALYLWEHEYYFLDLSKMVVKAAVTCLVPAPRLVGGWLVPFFPFTYIMWWATGTSFFLCSLALSIADYYKSRAEMYIHKYWNKRIKSKQEIIEESILCTARIFLVESLPEKDDVKKGFGKYIYASMFIFSLLVTVCYSSGLSSSLTIPRYVGTIKTVDDLVASGIPWGATSNVWIMSIGDAPEYNFVELLKRFHIKTAEVLKGLNDKQFAFVFERLPGGTFALSDYITEEGSKHLRVMSEDMYWGASVFMARKSSIWLPHLNDFILRAAQSGMPHIWEFKAATRHLNLKIQRAIKFSSLHEDQAAEPTKLNWNNVEGTFGIWSLLNLMAILAFILEVIVGNVKKKLRKMRHH